MIATESSARLVIGAAYPPSGPPPGGSVLLQVMDQICADALEAKGRYTGQLDVASGLPHGTGQMEYDEDDDDTDSEKEEGDPSHSKYAGDSVASYHGEWWYGYWQGGSPSNTCRLRNGDVYCGSMRKHERHGVGLYTWADTSSKGGKNSRITVKQRSYQGQFHHNQRQGHGKYIWRTIDLTSKQVLTESIYTGSFSDGQRQGHGVYLGPTLRYTGEWLAGKYHGYGVLEEHLLPSPTPSSGEATHGPRSTVYKGYFKQGRKHGRGGQFSPKSGRVLHDGLWEKDAPVSEEPAPPLPTPPSGAFLPRPTAVATAGRSVSSVVFSTPQPLADALGGKGLYKGIVQDGLPQGVGTMLYDPPSLASLQKHLHHKQKQPKQQQQESIGGMIAEYEGFWQAGNHHGFGRIRYQSGDTYEGNFVHNAKQGRGEYSYLEEAFSNSIGQPKRVYKGTFEKDVPHGPGFSVVYPNDDLFQGDYENGQRHGPNGRFEFANGSYYSGPFCQGMYQTPSEEASRPLVVAVPSDSPAATSDPEADLATTNSTTNEDLPLHGRLVTEHIVYVGPFSKGVFHGPGGKLTSATTDEILYEGAFVKGQPSDAAAAAKLLPEHLMIPHPPLDDPFAELDADSEDEQAFLKEHVVGAPLHTTTVEPPPPPGVPGLVQRVRSAASPILQDHKSLRAAPIPKGTFLPAPPSGNNPLLPPPPPAAPKLVGMGGGQPIPIPPPRKASLTSSLWEALGGAPSTTTAASQPTDAALTNEDTAEAKPRKEEDCKAVVDMEVWDGQENPGRYTGLLHLESQRPHGVGRMVYQDGNRIHEGFWVNGHRQGHGRCLFVMIGDYHEGNYHQNLRQGPGKYYWKDGRQFDGNYNQDERQGHGKFTYPNGDYYEGQFERGQRCGQGTFCFGGPERACRYKGGWKDGVYSGLGRLEWKDHSGRFRVYEGGFQEGAFHGAGVESADGKPIRHGIWHQGEYVPDETPEDEDEPDRRPSPPPEAFGHAHRFVEELEDDDEAAAKTSQDDFGDEPEGSELIDGPSEAALNEEAQEEWNDVDSHGEEGVDEDEDEETDYVPGETVEVDLGALARSEPTRRTRPAQTTRPRKHLSSIECASGQAEAPYELQRLQWKRSIEPEASV